MKKFLYHIFLPLIAGLLVYLFFRQPVTFLHEALGFKTTYLELPKNTFSNFLLFQVPDMLWAYSLTAILLFITQHRLISATLAIVLLSLVEYSQSTWRISNIDWVDIVSMLLAILLASNLVKK